LIGFGVIRRSGGAPQPALRVGEEVVPFAGHTDLPDHVANAPTLNPFLELGPDVWAATLERLQTIDADRIPLADVETLMPIAIGDYVDFYSSLEHATNAGQILRPGAPALHPNWRHLPVGYHGRSGSIVLSGTDIHRPHGQRPPAEPGGSPSFGPERKLDFELELGFVTGAEQQIFGFVLVNDWSAREVQLWESVPLGPFLSKSFATSIGAWITPHAALEPRRVAGPPQDPPPLPHLRVDEPRAYDLELEVELNDAVIARTNARWLYWSPRQQLAHATSNGARARPGDLFASGTISGAEPGSQGCLLELTRNAGPYLADGDTVVLRGAGLAEVRGTISPS
jgi:fumarylacetoacetase